MAIKKVNPLPMSVIQPQLTPYPDNYSRSRPIRPNPRPPPRQTRHPSRAPRRRSHPQQAISRLTLCPTGSIRARPRRYPRRRHSTSLPTPYHVLAETRHDHGDAVPTRLRRRGSQAAWDGRSSAQSAGGDSLRAYPASTDGTGEMGSYCCASWAGWGYGLG